MAIAQTTTKKEPVAHAGKRSGAQSGRARILKVSASLFREKGYAATSIRHIAARCQLKTASIYYHFASKEDILDAVLQEGIRALHASVRKAVEALPADAPAQERLAVAIHAHLNALHTRGDFIRANAREFERAPATIRRRNLALRQEYAEYWKELLGEARGAGAIRPDVDLSQLRLFILGALHWSMDWYDPSKRPISEIAANVFDYFFNGVGGRSSVHR